MKNRIFIILLTIFIISCSDDDDAFRNGTRSDTTPTRFRITVTNAINYLRVKTIRVITTGTTNMGSVEFYAVPGAKLSFASKLGNTNDIFFGPDGSGIALFDDDNNPIVGDVTDQIFLWDAGTAEDPDTNVRDVTTDILNADVNVEEVSGYLTAELFHELDDNLGGVNRNKFTLTITQMSTDRNITPGILVVHAQDNPLFTVGQPVTFGEPDRGAGLETLAEDGMPGDLVSWFTERVGDNGDGPFMRLSAALSSFSRGVAYVYDSISTPINPLFAQGQNDNMLKRTSGVEQLAEDGDNSMAAKYLEDMGIQVDYREKGISPGQNYSFILTASPTYKLGFATMFVASNDWLVALNTDGVALFDENGMPVSGTIYNRRMYLFDAGTEVDQPVGFGPDQPMIGGSGTGDLDNTTMIRRVDEINDLQFGKGMITSMPGVVAFEDERGGYNFVKINIEPLN